MVLSLDFQGGIHKGLETTITSLLVQFTVQTVGCLYLEEEYIEQLPEPAHGEIRQAFKCAFPHSTRKE